MIPASVCNGCHGQLVEPESTVQLRCGHVFHRSCIRQRMGEVSRFVCPVEGCEAPVNLQRDIGNRRIHEQPVDLNRLLRIYRRNQRLENIRLRVNITMFVVMTALVGMEGIGFLLGSRFTWSGTSGQLLVLTFVLLLLADGRMNLLGPQIEDKLALLVLGLSVGELLYQAAFSSRGFVRMQP